MPFTRKDTISPQQFNVVDQEHVGYTGLQPREDSNDSSITHAVFSNFILGTTSDNENCSDGAGDEPGISCVVDIPAPYDAQYELKISNDEGTTWTGTLVNSDSGEEFHIATYTISEGSGGITKAQMGFVERYLGKDTCAQLPFTWVMFGSPTTTTVGAGNGSLGDAYDAGGGVGESNFHKKGSDDTTEISTGVR